MNFLCSTYCENYDKLLKELRTLKKEDILLIIAHQKGFICKRYSYTILFYRTIESEENKNA